MDNARVDRRSQASLIAPTQDLPEPAHLERLERISKNQHAKSSDAAEHEKQRPRRSQPDLFASRVSRDRVAGHHGEFFAPSLERTRTPGRSSPKLMLCANWRQGKAASPAPRNTPPTDRKSTRLNSSHVSSSYAVFCLKKKNGRFARRSFRRTVRSCPLFPRTGRAYCCTEARSTCDRTARTAVNRGRDHHFVGGGIAHG